MDKKQFSSVSEMVKVASGDQNLANQLGERVEKRNVIKHLMALRAGRGMSQRDMANAMNCSQSRISKLESGIDDDLRVGDIDNYLNVLGLEARLVVSKTNMTLADHVKVDWKHLSGHLEQLRKLANGDAAIERGIREFSCEIAFNFIRTIAGFIARLPHTTKPRVPELRIEVDVDELDEIGAE